jgi:hypothetical protein
MSKCHSVKLTSHLIIFSGGDVILGADGCFSYRHLRSAGDGPISYDPNYFLSPEKVHRARDKVAEAWKKAPAKNKSPVPNEAVDGCKETWDAANEKKQKADPKRYDSSGIFAMTCRHSQVLFLANIDTPSEQQHYIVALLEELKDHVPPQATIVQAYDVGCILHRSLNLVSPSHTIPFQASDASHSLSIQFSHQVSGSVCRSLSMRCMHMATAGFASSFTVHAFGQELAWPIWRALSGSGPVSASSLASHVVNG